MTTKPSYTPALRFPDFLNDGEWEVKRLGEIAESFTGLTYSPEQVVEKEGTLVLRSSNIKNGVLSFEDNVYVQMEIPERAITHIGDLLICVRNGSKNLIGKSAVITKEAENMAFGAFMTVLRAKEGVDQIFLNYLWQSDLVQNQILRNLGSTINQITNKDLSGYKVCVPPFSEQRRIAQALTALDELIAATNEKLEQMKAYKKGLMQKLFPAKGKKLPELRFKEFKKDGGWEEVPFGSIIKECKDVSKVENEDVLLSSAIEGVFLNSEIFTHQRGSSNIGYRKLRKNMLILSAQNLHLGNANVNLRFEHGLISPAYKIYEINNCFPEFLYHWIKKDSTKEFFFDATIEGASVCRRNVMWNKLYEQKISNPSFLEQRKIASCLSTMDDQINAYTEKAGLLGQFKKGLMQRMFPQNQMN